MSDRTPAPILEILDALPMDSMSGLGRAPLALRIMAGQCVLIEAQHQSQVSEFGDLCCGLLPLRQGSVRFIGYDWNRVAHEGASAMRGQIGRVYGKTSWIGFLGTDLNILLPQLHHTRRSEQELRNVAAELARSFGLPGLPTGRPDSLGSTDLVRAACVRAFIGQPRLLILDNAELGQIDLLVPALVQALTAAHNRHAASIWLTHADLVWNDRFLPTAERLRLTDRGLVRMVQRP
jgi:phospholipid/cholesterol/gamma-HCH transport system ATP-binding protein